MTQLQAVLCTARTSPSVSYRPFRDQIDSVPFLQGWVDVFLERYPATPLNILCHTDLDESEISALVGTRVRVVRSNAATQLRVYADVVTTENGERPFVSRRWSCVNGVESLRSLFDRDVEAHKVPATYSASICLTDARDTNGTFGVCTD